MAAPSCMPSAGGTSGGMRPALFLHIQKTAGTSVQEMARRHYGNENVISHGDFLTLGANKIARVPFVSGHFGIAVARPHMAGRYAFTFLRHPTARLLSLYRFCHLQPPEAHALYAAAQGSLAEFLAHADDPDMRPFLDNNMVWQLAHGWVMERQSLQDVRFGDIPPERMLAMAKRTLSTFDHVGLMETFDTDIRAIFAALGAENASVPRSNVTHDGGGSEFVDRSMRARLDALTDLDRQLHEHAREIPPLRA